MGYAGATYIIQEFCNGLFDALFHILPLGTELDKIEATLGRAAEGTMPWEPEAQDLLDALLEQQPVLVRISAAKRFRDQAERDARETGKSHVQAQRFAELFGQSTPGVHA